MALRHFADCLCPPSCQILVTISQMAAELLWFSVFQNGGWCHTGRHLGFCCSPKMTSGNVAGCPWSPAYQIWWRYLKRRLSYGHFCFFQYGGRPPSWILLDCIFRPPTKSTWWPEATFKILCRSDLYFRRYCDFNFRKFGLKCPFEPKNGVFGGFRPLNISGYHWDPQEALPYYRPTCDKLLFIL